MSGALVRLAGLKDLRRAECLQRERLERRHPCSDQTCRAPTGRSPSSMNQFCDSHAEKSVNLRCW